MDRREFLTLTAASAVAAATVSIPDASAHVAPAKVVEPGRYSIGNSDLSVEWGWVHPDWSMSSREDYRTWDDEGPLAVDRGKYWRERQERARLLIIEHFGLERIMDTLPLEKIATISPAALFAMRRELETSCGFECKNDMISDRGGGHCSAEFCG